MVILLLAFISVCVAILTFGADAVSAAGRAVGVWTAKGCGAVLAFGYIVAVVLFMTAGQCP